MGPISHPVYAVTNEVCGNQSLIKCCASCQGVLAESYNTVPSCCSMSPLMFINTGSLNQMLCVLSKHALRIELISVRSHPPSKQGPGGASMRPGGGQLASIDPSSLVDSLCRRSEISRYTCAACCGLGHCLLWSELGRHPKSSRWRSS